MENNFIDPFKVQQIRVAVDSVCIAEENGEKYILLIKRVFEPFKNHWALPGGFLKEDEELEQGAIRELKEETNIEQEIKLEDVKQIKAYGKLNRDPRPRRIVSVAFLIEIEGLPSVKFSNESLEVKWIKLEELENTPLAFDHEEIVKDALKLI